MIAKYDSIAKKLLILSIMKHIIYFSKNYSKVYEHKFARTGQRCSKQGYCVAKICMRFEKM